MCPSSNELQAAPSISRKQQQQQQQQHQLQHRDSGTVIVNGTVIKKRTVSASMKRRVSKGLSRISINRLSVLVSSPKRKSETSLNDHLFPKMPYFNISVKNSSQSNRKGSAFPNIEGQYEEDEEGIAVLKKEMEYLPDPINPIIVQKVLHQYNPDMQNTSSDKYFFTNLYESIIKLHLKDLKQRKQVSGNSKSDFDDLEQSEDDILQKFDNSLTPTFSQQYDSSCSDFDKYDRKVKREVVLKNLTEDAFELKQISRTHGLLNVASAEDLHARFYSNDQDGDEIVSHEQIDSNDSIRDNTGSINSSMIIINNRNLFNMKSSLPNDGGLRVHKLAERIFPGRSLANVSISEPGSPRTHFKKTCQTSVKRHSMADSFSTIDVDEMSVVDAPLDEKTKNNFLSNTTTLQSTNASPPHHHHYHHHDRKLSDDSSFFNIDIEDADQITTADRDIEKNTHHNYHSRHHHNHQNYGLQRKLSPRVLQMIAFGSALGNGLLLNSGKNFTISGPLGTFLGFTISGLIVLAAMLSYCEVVTILPIADGVSGLTSRFVDDAYGFTLGWSYWLAFTISLPAEIIAGVVMLSYYESLDIPNSPATVAWILFFVVVIVGINMFDVRVFGEFEYGSNIIKILMIIMLSIVSVIINFGSGASNAKSTGYIGTTFWDSGKSNQTIGAYYGAFRPTFDLSDTGNGAINGIGGATGRFLAVLTSTGIASYAYCGTEIVGIAASEAKSPKKSLPSATKKVFWRILFFYILAVLLVGFNIYSGDPRLLRYFYSAENKNMDPYQSKYVLAETVSLKIRGIQICHPSNTATHATFGPFSSANKSPWVVAAQSVGMCNFASAVNAIIVFFALTSGSSQLYASSRTLYALSIQNKAPKLFSKCSRSGVPYCAVLFTGSFALLALVALSNNCLNAFTYFSNLTSTFVILSWAGMCLSFIRYYYALRLRPDIISRDDPTYPFKSPMQPYLGYFGLVGSCLIIVFVGVSTFMQGHFDLAIFLSSYGAVIVSVAVYFIYKLIYKTRVKKLHQIDLDTGRKESDREDWEEAKVYKGTKTEWLKKVKEYVF